MDGRFNEHATATSSRKGNSCAETVAKVLGIQSNPVVRRLVELVNATESGRWREAAKGLPAQVRVVTDFTLSALVRRLSDGGTSHMDLVRYFDPVFAMEVASQAEVARAAQAIETVGEFLEQNVAGGKATKIYVAETDIPNVHRAASQKGARVSVIRNPATGQTFITASTKSGLSLGEAVRALRVAEGEAGGNPIAAADAGGEQLPAPNDEWYYQAGAERIFNGRKGKSAEKPTRLSFRDVSKIVGENLQFAPKAAG